ncbi:hypothetical protein PtB15_10B140 [Puccinia triticina]|nr:hypothetical protein PtB15_10B140 [Puccinia triticina]
MSRSPMGSSMSSPFDIFLLAELFGWSSGGWAVLARGLVRNLEPLRHPTSCGTACDCVSPPLLDTVGSAVLAPMATLRAVYSPWLAFFSHQSASQSAAEPNVA